MEIVTCKMCGKIFNYLKGQNICPTCQKELEDKFKLARDYLYKNPRAGMHELAKHAEVPTSQINRWIREERLAFSDDSPITMSCEKCGTQIKTGRFCHTCKNSLQDGISEVAGLNKKIEKPKPKKEKTENKMRFLDSQK